MILCIKYPFRMKTLVPFLTNRKKHLKWFIPLLFLLFSINIAIAQTGLLFDDKAYGNFPLADAGVKNEVLPASYSLIKYCPFPKSQGNIASCVGWAVGYGALTIHQAQKSGITDRAYITNEMAHSASYIYNQIKSSDDCNAGASLTDALQLLQKKGNCLALTFPNSRTACDELPDSKAHQEASRFKLPTSAVKLFESNAAVRDKIKTTKIQLFRGNPVIIGFSVTPEYDQMRGKSVWQPDNTNKGGHAMVVIGYNDRLQAFELMNSFGTSWGDNGFIWLTYEDFGKYARQGFVLFQKDGGKGRDSIAVSDKPIRMSGAWQLQSKQAQASRFDEAAVIWQPEAGTYVVKKADWKLDEDLFRMQMQIPAGRCAYFFSMDASGAADSLWVMNYQDADTIVTLPPKGYFQFSKVGEENLCLLISYEKIENFTERLRKVQHYTHATIRQRLLQGFKDIVIDTTAIEYQQETPAFRAVSSYGKGIAIPLIVTIRIME